MKKMINPKSQIPKKNPEKNQSFFPVCNLFFRDCGFGKQGFSFIELIVVVSIFSLLSGVVIFNFGGFTTGITLQNIAQDVALQIRQAQNDALSGKTDEGFSKPLLPPDETLPKPSYGVYFSTDTSEPKYLKKFIYFADRNNNGTYDNMANVAGCDAHAECLNDIDINAGYTVSALYINQKSTKVDFLNIVFKRPNSDELIISSQPNAVVSDAEIVLMSPKGVSKTITVWSVGQISVQ